jgi:uncharacterized protein (TIGR02444 family)
MSEDRNSLIGWALDCYQQPGVMSTLLALQDECGLDVLLLLASAWLWTQGRRVSHEDMLPMLAQQQSWQDQVIKPLRLVRRKLKQDESAQSLYQQVKAVELEAELLQLRRLEPLFAELSVPVRLPLVEQLGVLAQVQGGGESGERLQALLDQYAAAVADFSSTAA